MNDKKNLIPVERIDSLIHRVRGENVILDADIARLYGVATGRLNEAVKRNKCRFPEDFMFQLSPVDFEQYKQRIAAANLLSQNAISSSKWGGRRNPPYAFTEQGVAMLASVLRSEQAVHVSIEIVRAFVRMRRLLAKQEGLAGKLDDLEKKYDAQFKVVFDAIRKLMQPPARERKPVGFHWEMSDRENIKRDRKGVETGHG